MRNQEFAAMFETLVNGDKCRAYRESMLKTWEFMLLDDKHCAQREASYGWGRCDPNNTVASDTWKALLRYAEGSVNEAIAILRNVKLGCRRTPGDASPGVVGALTFHVKPRRLILTVSKTILDS